VNAQYSNIQQPKKNNSSAIGHFHSRAVIRPADTITVAGRPVSGLRQHGDISLFKPRKDLLSIMKKTMLMAMLLASLNVLAAESGVGLDSDQKKISYAIGLSTAQSIVRQGVDLDLNAYMLGVRDALDNSPPRLTQEQFQSALANATSSVNDKLKARAKSNLEAGQAYLKENKGKEGVVELSNGIQYKELRKGSGGHPTLRDTVVVHYEGSLIDGTVFDSSKQRGEPATFPVNGVIKGWQEVLPLMAVGSRWQVAIPSSLAYGVKGAGAGIGPNETLRFEIELLEIAK
jgi:FKBP-type peptidyl-prolyl cis-trans isomerase FklB